MPARQDQTLQIFLIIFIFAFLVTAVVAYLGWRGYSEADAKATALQTSLNDKDHAESELRRPNLEDMRQIMGFGRNDNAADVKKAGEEDMKTYGSGIADEASRTYRKVLETVHAEGSGNGCPRGKAKGRLQRASQERCWPKNPKRRSKSTSTMTRGKKPRKMLAYATKWALPSSARTLERRRATLQKSLDDQRTKYEGADRRKDAARSKQLEGSSYQTRPCESKLERASKG